MKQYQKKSNNLKASDLTGEADLTSNSASDLKAKQSTSQSTRNSFSFRVEWLQTYH